jgi:hypothetical protein
MALEGGEKGRRGEERGGEGEPACAQPARRAAWGDGAGSPAEAGTCLSFHGVRHAYACHGALKELDVNKAPGCGGHVRQGGRGDGGGCSLTPSSRCVSATVVTACQLQWSRRVSYSGHGGP